MVLRIFEKEFAAKIEKHFGIDVALSSSSIAAPAFASAAMKNGMIGRVDLNGRQLRLKEALVNGRDEVGALLGRSEIKVLLFEQEDGTTVLNGIENCDGRGKIIYFTDATMSPVGSAGKRSL